MSESYPPPDTPKTCRHCGKVIVLQPGTNRHRSTEHDVAVDRMKCENAPDRRHQPAQPKMRPVLVQAPPQERQFRTGDAT